MSTYNKRISPIIFWSLGMSLLTFIPLVGFFLFVPIAVGCAVKSYVRLLEDPSVKGMPIIFASVLITMLGVLFNQMSARQFMDFFRQ